MVLIQYYLDKEETKINKCNVFEGEESTKSMTPDQKLELTKQSRNQVRQTVARRFKKKPKFVKYDGLNANQAIKKHDIIQNKQVYAAMRDGSFRDQLIAIKNKHMDHDLDKYNGNILQ